VPTTVRKTRIAVVFAALAMLIGSAGPAVAQIAYTHPIRLDISAMMYVSVLLENATPFEVTGFTIALLGTDGSPVCIDAARVYDYSGGFDPTSHPACYAVDDDGDYNSDSGEQDNLADPPAKIVNLIPNEDYRCLPKVFIQSGGLLAIGVGLSERAPEGTILQITFQWRAFDIFAAGAL
jgi:hypothetical protein